MAVVNSGFSLVSSDLFDQFVNKGITSLCEDTAEETICNTCGVPMQVSASSEYECPRCHKIVELEGVRNDHVTGNVNVRMKLRGRRCVISIAGGNNDSQRRELISTFMQLGDSYAGPKIPRDVLIRAANDYIEIQQSTTAGKKFVRRGSIREEVLSGLVYYECKRAAIYRKKKDVAEFMQLRNAGFSRGEDILRKLHVGGHISLPVNDDHTEDLLERYIEAMGIDVKYRAFIYDIVTLTEEMKIGMSSQISTKIIGTIWLLSEHVGLGFTLQEIEQRGDNIKKNTFLKFYKVLKAFLPLLIDTLHAHSIPLHKHALPRGRTPY